MTKGNKGWQGGEGPWGKTPGNIPPTPDGNRPDIDDIIEKAQARFRRFFQGGGDNKRGLLLVGLGIFFLWLASGIYIVRPDEQGVVMRFGKYHRTTGPGPSYHMPFPVEMVEKPKVTAINRIEIGVTPERYGYRNEQGGAVNESLMLTGDENIVDINFVVQWKIANAKQYLFNIRNPEAALKSVAESAMREMVGKSDINTIISENRLKTELGAKDLMQSILDHYKAGIEIVSVNMLKVDPPAAVIDAFRDVQAAKADQESARNEAEAYRNDIIPKARGQAEQMLQDAEAYKQRVMAEAKGNAARFLSVYNEYVQAKDVTRKRIYLDTMEKVLQGMEKIIIDGKGGSGVLPYLPLPDLRPKAQESQP